MVAGAILRDGRASRHCFAKERDHRMDLHTYLTALRKMWWAIVLTTVIGAAAGGYLAYRQTPQYASTVTFFATTQTTSAASGSSAFAGDQFAQQRVNTYVFLLSSDRLARMV